MTAQRLMTAAHRQRTVSMSPAAVGRLHRRRYQPAVTITHLHLHHQLVVDPRPLKKQQFDAMTARRQPTAAHPRLIAATADMTARHQVTAAVVTRLPAALQIRQGRVAAAAI